MTTKVSKAVWRESYEQGHRNGEGVTRCTDPNADYFWVNVHLVGTRPMASCVRAQTPEQAIEFCRARHPQAVMVELREVE